MKKYLLLIVTVWMGTWLYAGESLTFNTVLSKPVGSFWELETTTCSYPDVSGGPDTSQSEQVVINFGPTGLGGNIYLQGGPMNVNTLLMEDDSTLTTGSNVELMFASSGGKLTIYPTGAIQANSILINNLILPKNTVSTITVDNTTKIFWSELEVKNATINEFVNEFGWFSFAPNNDDSGNASFQSLAQSNAGSTDSPQPAGYNYYLRK